MEQNATTPGGAQPVTHGPYSLKASLTTGQPIIRRDDGDRERTVAIVDNLPQWDRFVAALNAGCDEVAAVHAIDAGSVLAAADDLLAAADRFDAALGEG